MPERSEARQGRFDGTRGARLLRLVAVALNRGDGERAAALLEAVADRFDDPIQIAFGEHGYTVHVVGRQ